MTLYSDSQYLVNAMAKGWAQRWQANGWKRNKREDSVNPDLWERMLELCRRHTVDFRWVRGHSGTKENERCDLLAVEAARESALPADPGYSRQSLRR